MENPNPIADYAVTVGKRVERNEMEHVVEHHVPGRRSVDMLFEEADDLRAERDG